MADTKENKQRGERAWPEPGTNYGFPEVRPQAEIVAEFYDHEDPTPTQEENDQAKKDALFVPPGAGDPQAADADAKKKKELEAANKPATGGYQTRAMPATTPKAE